MFGLFKKKTPGIKVVDKIWMTENASFRAIVAILKNKSDTLCLTWFADTKDKLCAYLQQHNLGTCNVQMADHTPIYLDVSHAIFIGHHPLESEEQKKFADLGLQEATIFTSLEEPIFQLFGGEKIIALMKKMGLQEDDVIEHKMISTSIKRAQKQIAEKAIITGHAKSQGDWLLNAGLGDQF